MKGKTRNFALPWMEWARCRILPEVDVSLMYSVDPEDIKIAKEVCAYCLVRTQCKSESVGEVGVWAGEHEFERVTSPSRRRHRKEGT